MPIDRSAERIECVRLRVEKRMSLREIQTETGISKGSLSKWLKPHPLTDEELSARRKAVLNPTHTPKDRGEPSELYLRVGGRAGLSNHQKAKIAEAAVLLRLVLHGMTPYGSPFDGDRADWVVEAPQTGRILKVQVKWAHEGRHGFPTVSLRRSTGEKRRKARYDSSDFDILAGYWFYRDTVHVWTAAEVEANSAGVTVSEDSEEKWEKLIGM